MNSMFCGRFLYSKLLTYWMCRFRYKLLLSRIIRGFLKEYSNGFINFIYLIASLEREGERESE